MAKMAVAASCNCGPCKHPGWKKRCALKGTASSSGVAELISASSRPLWETSPDVADGWILLQLCGYGIESAATMWRKLKRSKRQVPWPEALEALRDLSKIRSSKTSINETRARILADLEAHLQETPDAMASSSSAPPAPSAGDDGGADPQIPGEHPDDAVGEDPAPTTASEQRVELPAELAMLLGREDLPKVRKTPNGEYALADIGMAITGKDARHAAEDLRIVMDRYPEFATQEVDEILVHFQFAGQGQRTPTTVGKLAKVVEYIMLLPGKTAARVRVKAATILVRYLGGDLKLIDEVRALRRVQEHLADVDPGNWRRAFGEAVDTDHKEEEDRGDEKRRRLLDLQVEEQQEKNRQARAVADEAEAKAKEAEAKVKEAEAKAEEARVSVSARKQSVALQHYTETQLAAVSRVQTALQAYSACEGILGPLDETTRRRARDTIVTIATSHPRLDEDLGAPIRLVQFMMEEAQGGDEAWAFDKVPTFGRYAKQAIEKDYPALVPQKTQVHFRGRSCEAWQYYEAQRPTLRRALQDFLRQQPQHRPARQQQGIRSFLRTTASE